MGRPTTKAELIQASAEKYKEMNTLISSLTERELDTSFDFTKMKSKTQAHWKRDRNLRDVLVHLYEWHRLLLDWVAANREGGESKPLLPAPYNWKTYGDMNIEIWKKHQNTTLEAAREMLEQSHREVMALAETFSDRELFEKGVYSWVGSSTLGSYFASNMSSHYDWAIKKLKAHRKNCMQPE
ncbi:MAG: ClbS/DfsB family four-helix bundle protein [Acetatifactor sp.]|nr:ClbS/DfsB family four-helix bundle protein [Acetatifactor sp.]